MDGHLILQIWSSYFFRRRRYIHSRCWRVIHEDCPTNCLPERLELGFFVHLQSFLHLQCTYHGLKNYPPNNYVICVQNSPCKCSFMSFCITYRGTMVFKKSKEDWNWRHTMDLPYVIRMQKKPQGSFLNTMMANLIFSNPRSDQHRCFSLSVSAPLF